MLRKVRSNVSSYTMKDGGARVLRAGVDNSFSRNGRGGVEASNMESGESEH